MSAALPEPRGSRCEHRESSGLGYRCAMSARPFPIDWTFWSCAVGAMGLHALLVFSAPELRGGADLLPHLRLVQLMGEAPALRNVYAPAYHILGALISPLTGIALYQKVFTLAAAAIWIAAFRFFQRAADLPSASSALFALAPYSFALSSCPPKVEVLGYALAFLALGLLARRRYAAVAAVVATTFWVHTASALFLGVAGGVFALANRDLRGLAALAVGSLGAAPLLVAHLTAGCTPLQALMFSSNDYLRATADWSSVQVWDVICVLASPVAVILATLGARPLWRHSRPLAVTCAVLVALYLNELWLARLETRTALDLLRGLSVLAFPVAIAGGLALRARPRALPWVLAVCALWAVGASVWVVPRTFHTREFSLRELRDLRVARCTFRWQGPAIQRRRRHRAAPPPEPRREAVPPTRSGLEPSPSRRAVSLRYPAHVEDVGIREHVAHAVLHHLQIETLEHRRQLGRWPVVDRLHAHHQAVEQQREPPLPGGSVLHLLRDQDPTLSKALPQLRQKGGDLVPRQVMDQIEQVDRIEAALVAPAERVGHVILHIVHAEARGTHPGVLDAPAVDIDSHQPPTRLERREVEGEQAEPTGDIEDAAGRRQVLFDLLEEDLTQHREAQA